MRNVRTPIDVRFWQKVEKTENCWNWTASLSKQDGYGRINTGGRNGAQLLAHRASWIINRGPIPEGVILDHQCRNRACVNPDHLRFATDKLNSENHSGANKNSSTGVLGVTWDKSKRKYLAQVMHNYTNVYAGRYDTLEEADAAATAKRNELFTYNDVDRMVTK